MTMDHSLDDTYGLDDEAYAKIHRILDELDPGLRDSVNRIHRKLAAEFARGGRPSKLSAQDLTIMRRVAYTLREQPEFESVPLKTLDILVMMAAPQAWVEEERRKLGST
ncbi:hypothetical protein [Myxococcus virescens]|nr:hypothetical protein [Myxococcus virescens]SDF36257.1 hypothetical protein SAMN04488504_13516 [Myxococcus virescens]